MSQTGSLGTALGASASVLGGIRAAQTQNATNLAQLQIDQQQAAAREQQIAAAQAADVQSRALQLAHATAGTAANAAGNGLAPYDGSAAAIASGQAQEAAAAQQAANARYAAQAQAIAPSLLAPDGTATAFLRSGRTIGSLVNSLIG